MTGSKWVERAACKGQATAVFFPSKGESLKHARAYCDVCEVKTECLEEALTYERWDDHGVWGGTSAKQRDGIRAERKEARREAERAERKARKEQATTNEEGYRQ